MKKEETESARLADFEFRWRVRTVRLLAAGAGLDEDALVRRTAASDDAGLVAALEADTGRELGALHARCKEEARRQLVAERGDPAPVRLL